MLKSPPVIPVVVVIALALVMVVCAYSFPQIRLSVPSIAAKLIALFWVNASVLIFILSAWKFQQYRTTVNPVRAEQASTLLTGGIFRLSRNPMYLAFGGVLLAIASWLMHPIAFVCLPIYVLYMNRVQIRYEERMLQAKFGDAYQEYCTRVRRWL